METLVFEGLDKEKANVLKVVAKAIGASFSSNGKANNKVAKKKTKYRSSYNPEFVAMVEKGRQQIREGKTFTVKLEDLWK